MSKEPYVYVNCQFVARNAPETTTIRGERVTFGKGGPGGGGAELARLIRNFAIECAIFHVQALDMSIEEANAEIVRVGAALQETYLKEVEDHERLFNSDEHVQRAGYPGRAQDPDTPDDQEHLA